MSRCFREESLSGVIVSAGFIHATFWEQLVFPPHVPGAGKTPERRNMTWAIMGFTAMSLMWAAVYYFNNGDMVAVCLLHIIAVSSHYGWTICKPRKVAPQSQGHGKSLSCGEYAHNHSVFT
jgi:hypothetical protein